MEKIRAKHIIAMLLVLAAMVALCACAAQQVNVPAASETDIHEMQRLYRSSSLVVVAKCLRTHTDASGNVCCDVSVERTVAWHAGASWQNAALPAWQHEGGRGVSPLPCAGR